MGQLNSAKISITLLMLFILNGCGMMQNGKGWGEEATISPGWDRVGKAAYNSLVSPLTWGPVAGAAVLQIGDWDKHLSNWASDKTPIFGSQANANNWSDYLVYSSGVLYGATALWTPSGDQSGEWVTNKMKGFVVGGAALGLSVGTVELTNTVIKRERPDASSNDSFPSGHATAAASFATLAAKNIEVMQLSKPSEIAFDTGLGMIAAGTAWARVEAKKHYPSDVLAGIAIGHFLSAFVNDAFLGIDKSLGITPEADISRDGFHVNVAWHY
jgi:hypothetical protein